MRSLHSNMFLKNLSKVHIKLATTTQIPYHQIKNR